MKSRRAHAKSHFGCAQCKEKRVKCDEARPKCSRCNKRGSECTYAFIVFQDPSAPSRRKSTVAPQGEPSKPQPPIQYQFQAFDPEQELSPSSSRQDELSISTPSSGVHYLDTPESWQEDGTEDDNLPEAQPPVDLLTERELELYQYYKDIVCQKTLSSDIWAGFSIWGVSLRRHAPAQPFLYSGMIAISCFHLAMTHGNYGNVSNRQQYLPEALHHQTRALGEYRQLLHSLDKDNLEPALAFAALIIVTAFARQSSLQQDPNHCHDSIDEFVNDIAFFRGITYLNRLGMHQGLDERLAPLLRDRIMNARQAPHIGEWSLDALQADILSNIELLTQLDAGPEAGDFPYAAIESDSMRDPLDPFPPGRAPSEMYAFVLKKLRLQMRRGAAHPGKAGYIMIWPSVLPNSYTAALQARRPLALLLLAHWAAALHDLRDIWWINDFGQRIVATVGRRLQPEWLPYLKWPLEHVGLGLGLLDPASQMNPGF